MDVCRLCLDLVATQGEAKLLDGETRDMVQVVAPELNLEASKEPRACAECQRTLAHLFEFKSRVFEREGEVRSAVGPRCGQLSLKEALEGGAPAATNPGGGDGSTPAKAKDRVCRTCLTPIECESFTVLRPSEPDAYLSSMLDVCLVEVDLELTRDPVMCETCLEQLQRLHHFRSTCQDVEEKIVEFREGDGSAMDHVDLHAVLGAATPATPDVEMVTVKEEDEEGASSSGVVHRRGGRKRVRVEPVKAEPVKEEEEEDDESEEEDDEDEDMSEGEEDLDKALKQEELDIKSETGTSDSDKNRLLTKRKSQKLYKCEQCNYETTHCYNFRKHVKAIHTTPTYFYNCDLCEYKTPIKVYLKQHKLRHSASKEKIFSCELCDFTTRHAGYIKTHVKIKHTVRNELFSCEYCDFKTKCSKYVKEHTRYYHTDDAKLHKCDCCDYSTKFKSNLKEHVRIKHSEHSEIFRCESCEFKSPLKRNMKAHVRLHHRDDSESFECEMCEFRSTFKREVWRHMREMNHRKKKAPGYFPCSFCEFQTTHKEYLHCHVKRNHSGTTVMHKCRLCDYATRFKSALNRHMRRKHPKMLGQS